MANPTRYTPAGRVYNDLRNLARRNSRSKDEVMVEYVIERFLYHLASSPLGRESSPLPSHSATSTPVTATTATSTAYSPSTTWTAKNSPQH